MLDTSLNVMVVSVALIEADKYTVLSLDMPDCLLIHTWIGRPVANLFGIVEYVSSDIRLILISC